MSQKNNSRVLLNPSSYIDIILGSAVKQIAAVTYALSCKYGVDPDLFAKRLFFDWQSKLSCHLDGMLGLEIDGFFGPEDFVEAKLPHDKEALKMLEEIGDLWPMSEGWHLNPGPILDNMGACGNPRLGLVLALVNKRVIRRRLRKIIQEARDHARRDQLILEGMDEGWIPTRVVIKLQLSTVGATGSGSMHFLLGEDGIRSCAKEDGVESNVILQLICRGNLDTIDNEKSDLNEFFTLKHLQVLGSGAYHSSLTGTIQPNSFDALLLSSNQNSHGNMTSLEQLLAHQGHCDHFLFHTPAGGKMRERLQDILAVQYDKYGDPLIGLTMACAFLSRDSSRVLKFCKLKAAADLARSIAIEGDAGKIQRYAAGLARQNSIIESEQDNQLTRIVLRPADLQNECVIERAIASFEDRISSSHGLQRAVATDNSLKSILDNDIPETYEPCMRRQAQSHSHTIINVLERHLQQIMRYSHGLWESQKLYAFLRLIADRSVQALMEKARELRESLKLHEQVLAETSDRLNRLQQSNWAIRTANYPLLRTVSFSLEESGRAAISYKLQIAASEIAINDVLMPLIDYLDKRYGWLSGMAHKLRQIAQICENEADSVAAKPTALNNPLGIELATPEYLDNYFQDCVDKHGGSERFAAYLLSQFLNKYGSLAFLADACLEEYEEVFTAVCEEVFRPNIESTDVISEFRRLYPDKNRQRRIIERLIKQSEGSLRTTGEVNKAVVWIKAASVPSSEDAEWLRPILVSVDKKEGKWEIAVHNDPDRVSIAQLRGGILLQPFIDRVAPTDDPEGWAKIVDQAPDPVGGLTVCPNPSLRQFRRVLAKAIANNQLTVDEHGCFAISSSNGQSLILGKDFESVKAVLQPKWPELVFVESTFGYDLMIAEEQILSKLVSMKAQSRSGKDASDPLLDLIDLTAVDECLTQAQLLLPRLRRMRKAKQKVTANVAL